MKRDLEVLPPLTAAHLRLLLVCVQLSHLRSQQKMPSSFETAYEARVSPNGFDRTSDPVTNDEQISFKTYCKTRLTTLQPPLKKAENPFEVLALLNRMQWMQFLVAFVAWSWDAFDFFTVSMTISDLAETFDKSKTDITWGITLVLMLRSVGSIIFGIASDRWGRKWPFVVNNVLFIILELATGFCQTYTQFLWVRALFGIAMGGLYGNVAATALEDCPLAARGIISGMMQQGYAFGYLMAVVFARALVNTTSHGWRPLFWFGACPPVFIILFRLCLPETKVFQERQRVREASENMTRTFVAEGKIVLKRHWLLLCYMVLLMAGFNFMVRFCLILVVVVILAALLIISLARHYSLTARRTCTRPC